jgi:hypothetical protein
MDAFYGKHFSDFGPHGCQAAFPTAGPPPPPGANTSNLLLKPSLTDTARVKAL